MLPLPLEKDDTVRVVKSTSHQCLVSFFPVLPVPCYDNDGSGRPAHMTVHRVLLLDKEARRRGQSMWCDLASQRQGWVSNNHKSWDTRIQKATTWADTYHDGGQEHILLTHAYCMIELPALADLVPSCLEIKSRWVDQTRKRSPFSDLVQSSPLVLVATKNATAHATVTNQMSRTQCTSALVQEPQAGPRLSTVWSREGGPL
jgi:hypothetical protein